MQQLQKKKALSCRIVAKGEHTGCEETTCYTIGYFLSAICSNPKYKNIVDSLGQNMEYHIFQVYTTHGVGLKRIVLSLCLLCPAMVVASSKTT